MIAVAFDAVPPEQWDGLVHGSPDGWPFALTGWRRLILAVSEWRLEDHSFALTDGTQLCAVVPMQLDRRSGILGVTGWGGCGPIIAGELSGRRRHVACAAAIEAIDRIARDTAATALHLSVPPVTAASIENTRGVNPFVLHGLDDRSGIAQVIDLSADETALWRGLSETARQTVRKAEKAGIIVAQDGWPAMLDSYYRVHEENYRRTGVAPHPKAYFGGIAEEMAPAGYSVLWTARDANGEPIAFHNDMQFAAGAWYHTGCSTAPALDSGANYLLFWRAIMGAKAAGRLWYDCGEIFPPGADAKQNGLTLFKTRFGGEPHRFLKAGKTYGPQSRDFPGSDWLASLARRFVRRLRKLRPGG